MSATKGIKKHGQCAIEALMKEFLQMHEKGVFEALEASLLTAKQKAQALRAVKLIKEKHSGVLKGRTCADGRPQCELYSKAETASPTCTTDGLMMSIMIDAKEKRDVATADVVGAYLNALMTDFSS